MNTLKNIIRRMPSHIVCYGIRPAQLKRRKKKCINFQGAGIQRLTEIVNGKERDYQLEWCGKMGGEIEYVLEDKTRVDCLLPEYAVEMDFAKNWYESVGQALYYSEMTNRKAGVVLILKSKKDEKHLERLNKIKYEYGIKVWVIKNY